MAVTLNILPLPAQQIQLNILPPETQTQPAPNPTSRLLKDRYPEIFAQIHPTLNQGINLDKLTCATHQKLWWICPINKCGHHVWSAVVSSRTNRARPSGCPFCKGKQTCTCDSFMTRFPHLATEFAYDLNPGIDPYKVSPGAEKVFWWRCTQTQCGHHIWQALIYNRIKGAGCPFCCHKQTCPCESIATNYPHLVDEFHPELNPNIDLTTISFGSNIELWWQCLKAQCGHHIWKAKVCDRAEGTGCPFCNAKQTCSCDSFMSKYPHLAIEFSQELNPGIDPYTIAPKSAIKLWWCCPKPQCEHHIWRRPVSSRTIGYGCPFCHTSRLEQAISDTLVIMQISYETQKSFDLCRHIHPLHFDIFIPQYNALIEGDGAQHFEENPYFDRKGCSLSLRQTRDNVKNIFCRENGLHLLRISHSELENVSIHVQTFIQAIRTIHGAQRVEMFIGQEYQAPHD